MQHYGGALLCDAVGVGKTYVALAVASRFERCVIVAPAVLRDMWTRAVAATDVYATVISVESLGRGSERVPTAPLVIVDEAHHLRNPATRRYDVAARMCAAARTLLLTATPLHNTRRDLAALVALFAGVRAHAWTDDELASVVVRRARESIGEIVVPRIEHRSTPAIDGDEGVLDALLALPPPVAPADGAEAASLVVHSLVRQWSSSGAALRGALRRRIARGQALLAAFADGRHPTRAELRDWICTEDAVQLAFTELLAPTAVHDPALRSALERHVDALAAVLRRAEMDDAADRERTTMVHRICMRHAPARVVAFTCYQETAEMLYRALRDSVRAALLTGRGALVAGGPLGRAETLARFAPEASGARPVADHERIDVLVTTDLLSEGVNLQDAGVVIHLDLPWTSARLAQRVGRLARVGSRHPVVSAYTLRPSSRAESILRSTRIIEHKATLSARVLGAESDAATPVRWLGAGGASGVRDPASVECAEEIRQRLGRYATTPTRAGGANDGPIFVARGVAQVERALVACVVDGVPRLVVVAGGSVDTSAAAALATLDAALASSARTCSTDGGEARRVLDVVARWQCARDAARDAGVDLPVGESRVRAAMRTRRRAIGRLDHVAGTAPFAQRDAAAVRAAGLRAAAAEPAPIGLERMLYADPDAMTERTSHHARVDGGDGVEQEGRVIALLLLGPSG